MHSKGAHIGSLVSAVTCIRPYLVLRKAVSRPSTETFRTTLERGTVECSTRRRLWQGQSLCNHCLALDVVESSKVDESTSIYILEVYVQNFKIGGGPPRQFLLKVLDLSGRDPRQCTVSPDLLT